MKEGDTMFSIYYMNFQKAYEIKTMLSNVIAVEKSVEHSRGRDAEGDLQAKLGLKAFQLFDVSFGSDIKGTITNSDKVLDSFRVVMTKSLILNEVMSQCKSIENLDKPIKEGELIKINNVSLSLNNESDIRAMKMLSNGLLKGLSIPQANGLDINNVFSSILRDCSYQLLGECQNCKNPIIIKIPFASDNEFESQYNIDDLFIGKTSIIGIYKGKIKIEQLTSTLNSFQSNNSNSADSDIHLSQDFESQKTSKESDDVEYHYIDLIAVIQDVIADVSLPPQDCKGKWRCKSK